VTSADLLRSARRRCNLTQRELAQRTGIAQPTIARIEAGRVDPMLSTIERLLAACGARLRVDPQPGYGIDRTQMRELLKLTHAERLDLLRRDAAALAVFDQAIRR
jgi:transcriptional regulator with XRE-family HTH domain